MIADPYTQKNMCVQRLIDQYDEHGSLIVAFDFDGTVFDYEQIDAYFPWVVNLIRRCGKLGFSTILFTCREGEDLISAQSYCKALMIPVSYVNESPVNPHDRKPYFNILLDDRAGLHDACTILETVLEYVHNKRTGRDAL